MENVYVLLNLGQGHVRTNVATWEGKSGEDLGKKATNPVSEITSLVILIFLLHPWHSSSRVHSSFLSIGCGFFGTVDWE